MTFTFPCSACGGTHTGLPSFGAEAPWLYEQIAPDEREARCSIDSDGCIIDNLHHFVRATLDIPVHGQQEPFTWGVWVSLSEDSFNTWDLHFNETRRAHVGPFFGWFSNRLPGYPETLNLKTRVHLRDDGMRPLIELEPTDHPLAVEQRAGISLGRMAQLHALLMHGTSENNHG